jgi:hypothetical protein
MALLFNHYHHYYEDISSMLIWWSVCQEDHELKDRISLRGRCSGFIFDSASTPALESGSPLQNR